MIVAVHRGAAPVGASPAGSTQPLILSNPLWASHQSAAAFSACACVSAVNARQYFAFFNMVPMTSPAGQPNGPPVEGTSAKVGPHPAPLTEISRSM